VVRVAPAVRFAARPVFHARDERYEHFRR